MDHHVHAQQREALERERERQAAAKEEEEERLKAQLQADVEARVAAEPEQQHGWKRAGMHPMLADEQPGGEDMVVTCMVY